MMSEKTCCFIEVSDGNATGINGEYELHTKSAAGDTALTPLSIDINCFTILLQKFVLSPLPLRMPKELLL